MSNMFPRCIIIGTIPTRADGQRQQQEYRSRIHQYEHKKNLTIRFAVPKQKNWYFCPSKFSNIRIMATQPKKVETRNVAAPNTSRSIDDMIPAKARGPLAAIILFIALLMFFGKGLSSEKTFNAGDNVASEAVLPYLQAAQAAGQSVPQWIPNIFCGMPSYASLLSTGTRTY